MIKKVQLKFWISAMATMSFCVIALIVAINLIHSAQVNRQIDDALDEMISTVESVRNYSSQAALLEAELAAQEEAQDAELAAEKEALEAELASHKEAMENKPMEGGPFGHGGKDKKQWWEAQFGNQNNETTEIESEEAEKPETLNSEIGTYENVDTEAAKQEAAELRNSAMNQYSGRLTVVSFASDNSTQVAMSDSNMLSQDEALDIAEQILKFEAQFGDFDEYRYRVSSDDDGKWVYFLDCSTELASQKSLLNASIGIGLGGLLLTGLFVYWMSKKAVVPLKESMDLQKRFITDAGHELKTPLAVIGTNMDILEMDTGENEWVHGTKKQVSRLRMLVSNLISLSKLEEMQEDIQFQQVDLSKAAEECVETLRSQAKINDKNIDSEIESGITASGDTTMIGQLFTILCDNAVKYSTGDIDVRLHLSGKRPIFETENNWDHSLSSDELDKLFDRFYRGDSSRSNSDGKYGYGLGLSIAKALAEKNHAQLTAEETSEGRIRFKIVFKG